MENEIDVVKITSGDFEGVVSDNLDALKDLLQNIWENLHENDNKVTIEFTTMDKDEFDNLPEFEGV